MSAKARIRVHVEDLFLDAPKSHRTIELKEELIANLQEKFNDLVQQGRDEDTAYEIVITSIGDIDEVIGGLQEHFILDPEVVENGRRKSAFRIALSVGLYVFSFVPLMIGIASNDVIVGTAMMFAIWAVATMIIVYNAIAKPKYHKNQDTIVEDFKEYSREKKNSKTVKSSIDSILFSTAALVFVGGGLLTHRWNVLWLVFPLAAVLKQVVGLFFQHDR